MDLKTFVQLKDITLKQFCEQHNFNYPYFRQISCGIQTPSPKLALKIEKATKGKVKVLELLFPLGTVIACNRRDNHANSKNKNN